MTVIDFAAVRAATLIERRAFIGGSDAAAIIGRSNWKTPLRVWLEKRGELVEADDEQDPARQDLLETGKEMEPIIVNRLVRRFGIKVTKRSSQERPNRYFDKQHPFLACEIDFEWEVTREACAYISEEHPELSELAKSLIGTIQNGEAKKVHQFATAQFGKSGTEEVPIQYAAQATHGLGVTERQITLFAVQLGDDLQVYWVARDDDLVKKLRARCVAFWNENILKGIPPGVINVPDVLEMFRRVPPVKVEATEEDMELMREYAACKATAKVALERIDELKFELGKRMLGEASLRWERVDREMKMVPTPSTPLAKHALYFKGWPALEVGLQVQNRISATLVKAKHPDIVPDVTKEMKFFRFDQPKRKA